MLPALSSQATAPQLLRCRPILASGSGVAAAPTFIKPPGGRGGEAGAPPGAWEFCTDEAGAELELEVERGGPVPSRRRHGATSPSTLITPGLRRSTGATYSSIAQLELYDEARLHMHTMLEQLPPDQQAARCLAELRYLHGAVAKVLRDVDPSEGVGDEKLWSKQTSRLLRSPHLQTQVQRVLGKLEGVVGLILDSSPGDPLGDDHALDAVVKVLVEEAPVVADFLQVTWCLKLTPRNPLGYLRREKAKQKAAGRRGKPATGSRLEDLRVAAAAKKKERAGGGAAGGSDAASDAAATQLLSTLAPLTVVAEAVSPCGTGTGSDGTQPTQHPAAAAALGLLQFAAGFGLGAHGAAAASGAGPSGSGGGVGAGGTGSPSGTATLPLCHHCRQHRPDLRLVMCQQCESVPVHEDCCTAAFAPIRPPLPVPAGTALCPRCAEALREAVEDGGEDPPHGASTSPALLLPLSSSHSRRSVTSLTLTHPRAQMSRPLLAPSPRRSHLFSCVCSGPGAAMPPLLQ